MEETNEDDNTQTATGSGADNLDDGGDTLEDPTVELESVPLTFPSDQGSLLYVRYSRMKRASLSAFSHNHVIRAAGLD